MRGKKMKKKSKGYNKNATPKKVKENPKFDVMKAEIVDLKARKEYEDAMLKVIELFELGYNDVDVMYELAEIYYITNDFERAATWVGKILEANNRHQETLLLAIKIYNNSKQSEKALPIIELLLSMIDAKFINENEEFFKGIINKNIEQVTNYKLISNFINFNDFDEAENLSNEIPIQVKKVSINDYLRKILVQEEIADSEVDEIIKVSRDDISEEIMKFEASLVSKIALYNYFSFMQFKLNNFENSIYYLKQALIIDDQNDMLLKNIGFVLFKNNQIVEAKEYLQKVKNKDFMVLDLI